MLKQTDSPLCWFTAFICVHRMWISEWIDSGVPCIPTVQRKRDKRRKKKSNEKYLTTWLNANTCRAMRATNKYAASLSSFSTGRMWWDLHLLEHFYQTETIHTKIAFHHQITKNGRSLHAVINDLRFSPELIIKHEPVFRISATKVNVRQSIFPIHFNYFRELCACFCFHLFLFIFVAS